MPRHREITAEFALKWRFGLRSAVLIHARAASRDASVELSLNGRAADAKNLISMVGLAAGRAGVTRPGDRVRVRASGPDAEAALASLAEVFGFGARVEACPHAGCPSLPSLSALTAHSAEYACAELHLWTVERATGKVFAA
jgi:phosphotransferase system HPr (HPr) family protein